ncbi:lipoprotein [Mycoplasma putrefaciens]|uniref:Lipoprotein n=1 Tax=Mycoplasma putrefaciens (strain ATCC 15718 / NCTC 10155 / C30 KS-1 / KS-1) TaxID=743965 RepID=A0A7U4E9H1_MYCPK|nr:lipoprotein [Mycoplasma putrefaciens]AEM68490.1 lipoprotein [Mycoplasma putrefaciens KS1]
MKKLLSILGSVGMIASTGAVAVSCTNTEAMKWEEAYKEAFKKNIERILFINMSKYLPQQAANKLDLTEYFKDLWKDDLKTKADFENLKEEVKDEIFNIIKAAYPFEEFKKDENGKVTDITVVYDQDTFNDKEFEKLKPEEKLEQFEKNKAKIIKEFNEKVAAENLKIDELFKPILMLLK